MGSLLVTVVLLTVFAEFVRSDPLLAHAASEAAHRLDGYIRVILVAPPALIAFALFALALGVGQGACAVGRCLRHAISRR